MGNLVKETPYSEITATLETLDSQGMTREDLTKLRKDKAFAGRVVSYIKLDGWVRGTPPYKTARAILDENFFGLEGWTKFYGVSFSGKQLQKADKFPWSEDVLNAPCPFVEGKSIRETHFAFLGLETLNNKPLTISNFHDLHTCDEYIKIFSKTGEDLGFVGDPWQPWLWGNEKFITEHSCSFRWYLMLQEIVPGSGEKPYSEQMNMLPVEYEVPLAIEEYAKLILYHKKNGVRLNARSMARCRDRDRLKRCTGIGCFGFGGPSIETHEGDSISSHRGITASRKLPK